jgi:hypothetical protein
MEFGAAAAAARSWLARSISTPSMSGWRQRPAGVADQRDGAGQRSLGFQVRSGAGRRRRPD